jgi:hypothetical protein
MDDNCISRPATIRFPVLTLTVPILGDN